MTAWVAVILVCMGAEISQCNVAVYPTSYYKLMDCRSKIATAYQMTKGTGLVVSGSCSQVKIEGTDI